MMHFNALLTILLVGAVVNAVLLRCNSVRKSFFFSHFCERTLCNGACRSRGFPTIKADLFSLLLLFPSFLSLPFSPFKTRPMSFAEPQQNFMIPSRCNTTFRRTAVGGRSRRGTATTRSSTPALPYLLWRLANGDERGPIYTPPQSVADSSDTGTRGTPSSTSTARGYNATTGETNRSSSTAGRRLRATTYRHEDADISIVSNSTTLGVDRGQRDFPGPYPNQQALAEHHAEQPVALSEANLEAHNTGNLSNAAPRGSSVVRDSRHPSSLHSSSTVEGTAPARGHSSRNDNVPERASYAGLSGSMASSSVDTLHYDTPDSEDEVEELRAHNGPRSVHRPSVGGRRTAGSRGATSDSASGIARLTPSNSTRSEHSFGDYATRYMPYPWPVPSHDTSPAASANNNADGSSRRGTPYSIVFTGPRRSELSVSNIGTLSVSQPISAQQRPQQYDTQYISHRSQTPQAGHRPTASTTHVRDQPTRRAAPFPTTFTGARTPKPDPSSTLRRTPLSAYDSLWNNTGTSGSYAGTAHGPARISQSNNHGGLPRSSPTAHGRQRPHSYYDEGYSMIDEAIETASRERAGHSYHSRPRN